jgi:hypothetical protein
MIVESRVVKGILTLGDTVPEDFSCQPTNIRVTPTTDDDGDPVEVLCGDTVPAGKKESWVLAGTAIQDFDSPTGFLAYCYEHALETVPFEWTPNIDGAPVWSGSVLIEALEEGGDVNTRITSDFEFDCVGRPTRAYTTPLAAGTEGAEGAESGNVRTRKAAEAA